MTLTSIVSFRLIGQDYILQKGSFRQTQNIPPDHPGARDLEEFDNVSNNIPYRILSPRVQRWLQNQGKVFDSIYFGNTAPDKGLAMWVILSRLEELNGFAGSKITNFQVWAVMSEKMIRNEWLASQNFTGR